MPEVRQIPTGDTPERVLAAAVAKVTADLADLRAMFLARTSGAGGRLDAQIALVPTNEATSSTTYTDLDTPGPAVTLTTGPQVLVLIQAVGFNVSASQAGLMAVAVSGATTRAASDTDNAQTLSASTVNGPAVSGAALLTGLTPGENTFTMKYRSPGGTSHHYFHRQITVIAL